MRQQKFYAGLALLAALVSAEGAWADPSREAERAASASDATVSAEQRQRLRVVENVTRHAVEASKAFAGRPL